MEEVLPFWLKIRSWWIFRRQENAREVERYLLFIIYVGRGSIVAIVLLLIVNGIDGMNFHNNRETTTYRSYCLLSLLPGHDEDRYIASLNLQTVSKRVMWLWDLQVV